MSSGKSPHPSAVEAGFFAGGGLEEQLKTYRRKQVRHFRHIVTITLFFAVVIWFLSGLVDQARYEFQVAPVATPIGDVINVGAKALPHNAYISLEGITEHRGLTQSIMRDLSFDRQEYWYFRLLGSGGIFVEVPPDEDAYGIATKVAVSGRVVDPTKTQPTSVCWKCIMTVFWGRPRTLGSFKWTAYRVRPEVVSIWL